MTSTSNDDPNLTGPVYNEGYYQSFTIRVKSSQEQVWVKLDTEKMKRERETREMNDWIERKMRWMTGFSLQTRKTKKICGWKSLRWKASLIMKKMTKQQQIKHEEDYVEFLRVRLASANYKANVSVEEYNKTKEKYDKAKFRLKTLKM